MILYLSFCFFLSFFFLSPPLSLFLFACLPLCLSASVPLRLSVSITLFFSQSISLSLSVSIISPSLSLSASLSLSLVCLCVRLCLCLCLSLSLFTFYVPCCLLNPPTPLSFSVFLSFQSLRDMQFRQFACINTTNKKCNLVFLSGGRVNQKGDLVKIPGQGSSNNKEGFHTQWQTYCFMAYC